MLKFYKNCTYEKYCPSPDCSANPFWAFSAQKDWSGKQDKAPKKNPLHKK